MKFAGSTRLREAPPAKPEAGPNTVNIMWGGGGGGCFLLRSERSIIRILEACSRAVLLVGLTGSRKASAYVGGGNWEFKLQESQRLLF